MHLHKIEDDFLEFHERLNRARHLFMVTFSSFGCDWRANPLFQIGGSVRTEIIVTRIEKSNGQIETKVDQNSAEVVSVL